MSRSPILTVLFALLPLAFSPIPVPAQAAATPKPTLKETDEAMTSFAATLRNADRIRFEVTLSARSVTRNQARPLANSVYLVTAERPNRVRIEPKDPKKYALLISNGERLVIQAADKEAPVLNVKAPASFGGFRRELPKNLGVVELSVFNTVLGLLTNDPAGFLVGDALDRSRYATFMADGIAGEMFRFRDNERETLIGLSANARPLLLRLTMDTNVHDTGAVVLSYSFKDWNLSPRLRADAFRLPGEKASDSTKPSEDAPVRKSGIIIEDSAKP
jgi:hypothetical protein